MPAACVMQHQRSLKTFSIPFSHGFHKKLFYGNIAATRFLKRFLLKCFPGQPLKGEMATFPQPPLLLNLWTHLVPSTVYITFFKIKILVAIFTSPLTLNTGEETQKRQFGYQAQRNIREFWLQGTIEKPVKSGEKLKEFRHCS